MAITWSDVNSGAGGYCKTVKAVCSSGTESFAAAATDGMPLPLVGAFDVVLEADSGQTLSGAGSLFCYIYSDATGGWARAPDFDVAVPAEVASNRRYIPLGTSSGKGVPVLARDGRVAYVPNGVTVSSGGVTVYLEPYGGAE